MKKILFTAILTLISIHTATAQVGIGTTSPDASAQLELQSTAKGFLPPRMTTNERNLIDTPAEGLVIYNATTKRLNLFNATQWTTMDGTSASSAPNAPAITGVTSGNGQVDVAFTAPADNGGSTITTYTATSSPGGITGTLSQAGGGTITVSGLTNGTAYTFTVTATNALGTSAASAASASATPATVPDAPAITGVTTVYGQADVAFTAPTDNGGSTITTYTATSSPGSFTGTLSQAGSGTITVSGLTNGTAYTFTVTATNALGTSAASAASASITPSWAAGEVTYTILDQYTNDVPTGTSYTKLELYNEYVDAGSVDASPFVITKQTSHTGGILFYGTTELISEASANTFRLTTSTGNFDFISFYLDDLEQNINGGTSSTLPRITLTSSSGSTVTYEATVMDCDDSIGCMYYFSDTGVKTLNWNNVEWVDIETQYVKAKTRTYVLKKLQ
jgi:hypothetical protein